MDRLNSCKITGCREPIEDRLGRYARLCSTHKAEQRERIALLPPPSASKTKPGSLVADAQKMLAGARLVERATTRLAKIPSAEKERQAFVDAAGAAQREPSEANLAALTAATLSYKRGLPTRSKREAELAEAERTLTANVRAFLIRLEDRPAAQAA